MNKQINICQYKVIGNCVNFEMNILIRKVLTLILLMWRIG